MKSSLMTAMSAALTSVAASANAHGPAADQAAKAVSKATALFLTGEPAATQAGFQAVSASVVGEESFLVRISTSKGVLQYSCGLDIHTKPASWGCKKN
jgi:hypothetical protein